MSAGVCELHIGPKTKSKWCPICLMDERDKYRDQNAILTKALKDAVAAFDCDSVQGSGDYHKGLCCGLEDRGVIDRYEAMEYGYECALERMSYEIMGPIEHAIREIVKKEVGR